MATRFGVHFANFKYLDPTGAFSGKPPVRPGTSDAQLFDDMCQKIEESGSTSIKLLIYSYAGDPNRAQWLDAQQRMLAGLHNRFPQAAFILRLDHNPYVNPDFEAGAAQMAADFQPIVDNVTKIVQDEDGNPPIWIIVANEPNHPVEGFNQDPVYFNGFFKAVVWHFWNDHPIYSKKSLGGPTHGIFYPGLSPNPTLNSLAWYQHPSTLAILHPTIGEPGKRVQQCWCNGVELHDYWQTGQVTDPQWGEFYKGMWKQGVAPVNPYMPIIIGEWGNSSTDDKDTVKTPEYLQWLKNLKNQRTIPPSLLVASSGFIVDGTDDWIDFQWTHHMAQSIGGLGL